MIGGDVVWWIEEAELIGPEDFEIALSCWAGQHATSKPQSPQSLNLSDAVIAGLDVMEAV